MVVILICVAAVMLMGGGSNQKDDSDRNVVAFENPMYDDPNQQAYGAQPAYGAPPPQGSGKDSPDGGCLTQGTVTSEMSCEAPAIAPEPYERGPFLVVIAVGEQVLGHAHLHGLLEHFVTFVAATCVGSPHLTVNGLGEASARVRRRD